MALTIKIKNKANIFNGLLSLKSLSGKSEKNAREWSVTTVIKIISRKKSDIKF